MHRTTRRLTRRFLVSAAVAVMSIGAIGSQGIQAQAQTITMGTSPDYPPYEFYDTSGGQEEIVGFDIDIARAVATELGYELEIVGMDFNGLIPALQAERVDFVMAGMTPTEERKKNVDFSEIYFEAQNTIVSKQGSGLETVADLTDKRVGVQLGSIQEDEAKDFVEADPSIELKSLNKIGELIQEIKSGRLDAVIMEDTVAQGFAASNEDLEFSVIPSDGPSGSAVAFPKGSDLVDDFNQVLVELKESGEIDRLAAQWFGDTP